MLIDVIHPEFVGAKSTVKELLIQLAAREGPARKPGSNATRNLGLDAHQTKQGRARQGVRRSRRIEGSLRHSS